MEPWQSWTAVGVLGAGMYWYYTTQQTKHRKAPKASIPNEAPQPARRKTDTKPRRKKDPISKVSDQGTSDVPDVTSASGLSSGNEQLKKRKGNKKGPNTAAKSSTMDVKASEPSRSPPQEDDGGNDELNNREFARQLASKKAGTNLSGPTKQSQPLRTQKLGKAKATFDDEHLSPSSSSLDPHAHSSTSSTTGADADDDLSSSNSPALGAAQPSSSGSQGGVADMLEAPAPGTSVLRLTDPVQPARTASANRQAKPAQQEETKKQRQNRKRAEQRKLEQQEAEKQRRILLERQLRTAREAEGRPAKNGVPIPGKAPSSSWTKPPQVTPDAPSDAPLLDTLEPSPSKPAPSSTTTTTPQPWPKSGPLPSEEEQLRLLSEMDADDWQTVEKPKKKDRSAANGRAGGGGGVVTASSSSTGGEEEKTAAPAVKEEPEVEKTSAADDGAVDDKEGGEGPKKVNERGYRDGIYVPYAETGHPGDSDWAVS